MPTNTPVSTIHDPNIHQKAYTTTDPIETATTQRAKGQMHKEVSHDLTNNHRNSFFIHNFGGHPGNSLSKTVANDSHSNPAED